MSYTMVLGPTHAAWRGSQRFMLTIDGERVRDVEYASDQQPAGLVERLPRLQPSDALVRVTEACNTCSNTHALAFCNAYEQLCSCLAPARASSMRCAIVELERVAAHLEGVARLLWALGMEPQHTQFSSFIALARDALAALAGSESRSCIALGGLANNVSREQIEHAQLLITKLNRLLYPAIERLIDHQALLARAVEVAALPRAAAEQFGVRGPLARAAGIAHDLRVDQPYEVYANIAIRMIIQENGDVYARLVVLMLEAYESIKLAEHILREIPDGPWQTRLPDTVPDQIATVGVEGPYGPLRYMLEGNGIRLTRVGIDPPRQFDRLLVRTLISGALVDDIAMIIASANQCVACSTIH